jgi:hypothetical protein
MHERKPSWEQALVWLVVGAVSLQVVADVLPHIVFPLAVLGVLVAVVRVVFFHTRKW